ncbi:UDP-glycosyltransferase 76F1 [Heracleum sosnowskyi]|uniref:UDP-glycosyltransferase 76F1 n=1 Tax=Heracleum sosnowskyi TaxID=360622 RepID=A0AAD8H4S0_9APIA|nr:UDP-glycosyltransferase 76F1 [Heracleum sosnowskyi]
MSKGRLLLFPLPFQGHINPMLQLANILHSKGFDITIIHTSFNSPNTSNHPHFTFESFAEETLAGYDTSLLGNVKNVILLLNLVNKVWFHPFRDCVKRLLSNSSAEDPIRCLISDATLYFTQAVTEGLELPRIVLRTSSLCSFHVFHSFPLLLQKGYLSMEDSESETPVVEVPPLKVKDLSSTFKIEGEALDVMLSGLMSGTKAASGLIWNSFEELEHSTLPTIHQEFPIPNFTIGPFHKYFTATASSLLAQDQTALSWLDMQAPLSVLYVSFGSIAAIDKTEFFELAWGLANSKQRFLWVVRPGVIRGSEWLEPFPAGLLEAVSERGHIVKWAPQQQVLAHPATACFWSHCGWNSTLESICEGVPMICSPSFGDQPTNARYVEAVWKVGLVLENGFEREEITKAIRRVMVDQEGREMKMRMSCLKEKVNICLMEGGSSYKSLESLVSFILSL